MKRLESPTFPGDWTQWFYHSRLISKLFIAALHFIDITTSYLFAGFHNFLQVVISMNSLDCRQSLATIPLLDPYMNEVASCTAPVIVNSGQKWVCLKVETGIC